ncbi:MAG: DUF4190 domain-containing protein [Actinobacteria bacterium]|nr:DUF4190 domain-containing protein [Actinomycetota bacterium]
MSVDGGTPPNASHAVTAFVLGILGVILFPPLGPVAWVLGRRAEQEIDASGGATGGRVLATIGKILGMIGTFFVVLLIFVGIALVAGSGDAS